MKHREIWLSSMEKIAVPVLSALAENKLKQTFPLSFHEQRSEYAPLEAFGRTLCGIAPYLEAQGLEKEEKARQQKLLSLSQKAIKNATAPNAPDFLNFCRGQGQPLVDTAFLAHAIVRAPNALYFDLDEKTRANIADALLSSRVFSPHDCNWLFFSAMVECALFVMGQDYDKKAVDNAVNKFAESYYVGDGTYGDGKYFHWDYYNSFVIGPMFVDILRTMQGEDENYAKLYPTVLARASRFSAVLEQLISHDGTYAVFGRSITYRFGAFQLLSQAALQEFLPEQISFAQVRCALSAVIQKCMENKDIFDENGWLLPGVYGHQPSLAEPYINIGSLYLCCAVFLALGLSPSHPFWSDPDADWTAKKIWSGIDVMRDHSVD